MSILHEINESLQDLADHGQLKVKDGKIQLKKFCSWCYQEEDSGHTCAECNEPLDALTCAEQTGWCNTCLNNQ